MKKILLITLFLLLVIKIVFASPRTITCASPGKDGLGQSNDTNGVINTYFHGGTRLIAAGSTTISNYGYSTRTDDKKNT
jgi:hypothetical protein